MAKLDGFSPLKALGFGALLAVANAKNLPIALSAAGTIARAELPGGRQVIALLVFAVLASVRVVVPWLVYLLGGKSSAHVLDGWKSWLSTNTATIMTVLFLILGTNLIGKGIAGLS
jgi:hypothetical protein